jgi:1-acyl-sn-glycerol-3-phosphate acyltransferase
MVTPGTQLDRLAVERGVQEALRGLLAELGSPAVLRADAADAHLERDLGLGSLERVELMLRLGAAFGVHLPDRVVAEADTVSDLVAAVLTAARSGERPELYSHELGRVRRAVAAAPSELVAPEAAETLTEILRWRGQAEAGRPHIFLREEDGATHTLTYAELLARAGGVARRLQDRGLAPGNAVALMLPTGCEFFYAFFGVLLAGGVPVPIYPPFRADRIEEYAARQSEILKNAEARWLVTFREGETVARLLKPRVPSLDAVLLGARLAEPGAAPPALYRSRPEDIAFLQYTSGSTGDPKGVVLTHANLLANIRAIAEAVEVRAGDLAVSWLPLYHDMGLIGTWFTPLYCGIPLAVLSPLAFLSRPERWLWAIHHHRGTLSAAPNFAYELCVRKITERDLEGLDLSTWRAALNGAEPVNPETLERFAERFAPYGFRREALTPVYGLAEATLAVTIPPLGRGPQVDRIERATFEREGRALPAAPDDPNALRFVSAGRPVPGYEVRIVDEAGRDAGNRAEGQLWFRGPGATRGYYHNPEATRAILRGEWLDSGDRAYTADGEVYITGRTKDIIIKAGRNLYPHEVEEIAGRVEGVRTGCAVAFGLSDAEAGTERLVVVAEFRAARRGAHETGSRERIAAAICESIAGVLGLPPDVVEMVPPQSIPKTSSGKLRRDATKRLYLEGKLGSPKPPAWVQVARLAATGGARQIVGASKSLAHRALEAAYGVYAASLFALLLVPTWLLVLAAPGRRAAAGVTRLGIRIFLALAGCRVRVEGRERLAELLRPGEPRVFVANHTSYADVLFLLAVLPAGYRFVAKLEVHGMPFIRTFIRKLGHFAFDRSDREARLRQVDEIEEALRQGDSVFVFPEGTFTPAPGVRAFQLGAFKAAVATGCAVVPVALCGTREILRDETWLPKPGRVTLTLLPPILPARDGWQEIVRLRDAARAAIAAHSGEPLL